MTFPDGFADVVLSSAVLHFARDEAQFEAMVREMWRVLKPGGMLFAGLPRRLEWKIACGRSAGGDSRFPTGASAISWTRRC